MSHYIAGGLMILMLCAAALLGAEAYGVYHAAHMVEAALLDGQMRLGADGGVSAEVRRHVVRRVAAEGGNPDRLTVSGTQPGAPFGESVTLRIVYEHRYALARLIPGGGWHSGPFRIERAATTMSGWQP